MYPIKIKPAFKDYLWGGDKLKTEYNKKTDMTPLAESWELSCHPNGQSIVIDGEFNGKPLSDYIKHYGPACLGTKAEKFENFPILIKLIDAKDFLSIQVHPNNEYALKNENQYGKTEMWYIVDCDEGAYLYYGFKHEITPEEFEERINSNTLLEVLNKVEVKKGDMFFISPGTLHAIGKGILIAEIQQNSDVTYRIYDYGRKDAQGNSRELHIEKALQVTKLCPPQKEDSVIMKVTENQGYTSTHLAKCEYFDVTAIDLNGTGELTVEDDSFVSLLNVEGDYTLSCNDVTLTIAKGESVFIPANSGKVNISGNAKIILSKVGY